MCWETCGKATERMESQVEKADSATGAVSCSDYLGHGIAVA